MSGGTVMAATAASSAGSVAAGGNAGPHGVLEGSPPSGPQMGYGGAMAVVASSPGALHHAASPMILQHAAGLGQGLWGDRGEEGRQEGGRQGAAHRAGGGDSSGGGSDEAGGEGLGQGQGRGGDGGSEGEVADLAPLKAALLSACEAWKLKRSHPPQGGGGQARAQGGGRGTEGQGGGRAGAERRSGTGPGAVKGSPKAGGMAAAVQAQLSPVAAAARPGSTGGVGSVGGVAHVAVMDASLMATERGLLRLAFDHWRSAPATVAHAHAHGITAAAATAAAVAHGTTAAATAVSASPRRGDAAPGAKAAAPAVKKSSSALSSRVRGILGGLESPSKRKPSPRQAASFTAPPGLGGGSAAPGTAAAVVPSANVAAAAAAAAGPRLTASAGGKLRRSERALAQELLQQLVALGFGPGGPRLALGTGVGTGVRAGVGTGVGSGQGVTSAGGGGGDRMGVAQWVAAHALSAPGHTDAGLGAGMGPGAGGTAHTIQIHSKSPPAFGSKTLGGRAALGNVGSVWGQVAAQGSTAAAAAAALGQPPPLFSPPLRRPGSGALDRRRSKSASASPAQVSAAAYAQSVYAQPGLRSATGVNAGSVFNVGASLVDTGTGSVARFNIAPSPAASPLPLAPHLHTFGPGQTAALSGMRTSGHRLTVNPSSPVASSPGGPLRLGVSASAGGGKSGAARPLDLAFYGVQDAFDPPRPTL